MYINTTFPTDFLNQVFGEVRFLIFIQYLRMFINNVVYLFSLK